MDSKEREAKVACPFPSPNALITYIQTHDVRGDQLASSAPSEALTEFTTAIELYLYIISSPSSSATQKSRCRSLCRDLIAKAERLKRWISQNGASTKKSTVPGSQNRVLMASSEEKLSVKEQTILLKSSKINGGKYPPLSPGTKPVVESDGVYT